MKKKDVCFNVGLKGKGSLEGAKRLLSQRFSDAVEVYNYIEIARMVACRTDRKTYQVFDTGIEQSPSMAGKPGYTKEGYTERRKAKIPDEWRDEVSYVGLNVIRTHPPIYS